MYSKNNNVKIIVGTKTFDIIREPTESIIIKFQDGSEELINGSDFVFKIMCTACYKFQKIGSKSIG